MIPFTFVAIMPTNKALFAVELDDGSIPELLKKWGKLHRIRSVVGALGFIILVGARRR